MFTSFRIFEPNKLVLEFGAIIKLDHVLGIL